MIAKHVVLRWLHLVRIVSHKNQFRFNVDFPHKIRSGFDENFSDKIQSGFDENFLESTSRASAIPDIYHLILIHRQDL